MSKGDYQSNKRMERIRMLERSIKLATQENGCALLNKTIAIYSIETGIRFKVVREYVNLLELAGIIKINGNEITHMHVKDEEKENESFKGLAIQE